LLPLADRRRKIESIEDQEISDFAEPPVLS